MVIPSGVLPGTSMPYVRIDAAQLPHQKFMYVLSAQYISVLIIQVLVLEYNVPVKPGLH